MLRVQRLGQRAESTTPAIRPDGSHFEYRGHNPAADAFVEYVNAALSPRDSDHARLSWRDARGEQLAGVLTSSLSWATIASIAVELALAAQEVGEADLGLLAVQVAVEVEQVGLEQRRLGVLVERRAAAEVDRTRVLGPSARSYHPAYTPSAGMQT